MNGNTALIKSTIRIKKYGNGSFKMIVTPKAIEEKDEKKELLAFLKSGGTVRDFIKKKREEENKRKRLSGTIKRFKERVKSINTYKYFITLTTDNIELV